MAFGTKASVPGESIDARRQADLLAQRERKQAEVAAAEARKRVDQSPRLGGEGDSPAARAQAAFLRGDHIFQYSIDVMSQQAVIVPMIGSSNVQTTADPVNVLNSVCHEGWDLVNGSFVFVEEGQQSRDKFMSSGQNVAVKGKTVGYYLFRRAEQNRRAVT